MCVKLYSKVIKASIVDEAEGAGPAHTEAFLGLGDSVLAGRMSRQPQQSVHGAIAPFASVRLRLELCPRRLNPDYRKQITIVNEKNADNELLVGVRANNIDRHGVTFHYSLYHVPNSINFDNLVASCPAVRTFSIKNTTDRMLMLGVCALRCCRRTCTHLNRSDVALQSFSHRSATTSSCLSRATAKRYVCLLSARGSKVS